MRLFYRNNLSDSLKLLGIETMFTEKANFGLMIDVPEIKNSSDNKLVFRSPEDVEESDGKMSLDALSTLPNPGIHVDSIIHEVQININGKLFVIYLESF